MGRVDTYHGEYKVNVDSFKASHKEFIKNNELISKKAIQNTAEATHDLIGEKIADVISQVSRNSPHNTSETVKVKQKYLKKEIYL